MSSLLNGYRFIICSSGRDRNWELGAGAYRAVNSSKLSSWWSEAPVEASAVRMTVVEKVRVVLLERASKGRRMMGEVR